jgi:hypothetical protein
MNKYKIRGGRYGGEFVILKKDEEFFEEWQSRFEYEDDDDVNEELIELLRDEVSHEESIEQIYNVYADSVFHIYKIEENGEETHIETCGIDSFVSREAYTQEDKEEKSFPVAVYHSSEKGDFKNWDLELDGEIDITKLGTAVVETSCGEFVENLYYDGDLLEDESGDTWGNYEEVFVCWFNPECHEKYSIFTEEYVKQAWQEFN